jgi:ABC-type nitrate/sulfonate/bicarbonate transport system ATPase subunit
MEAMIDIRKLSLAFGEGAKRQLVLRNLDLKVRPGEFLAIVGPSGVGASSPG